MFHRAVSAARTFGRYWLPVLLWMGLIFTASSDSASVRRSSRLIGPLVRWLFPALPRARVDDVVFLVRKTAHVAEYAVLTGLVWRALRRPVQSDPRPWLWSQAWGALLIAVLYAGSDEFHQTFVKNRMGSSSDLLLDSTGAAFGLLVLWGWGRWRQRW